MIELKKECCNIIPIQVPEQSSLKSVNFYLVKRGDHLILIDAGWNNEACWNEFNNTLHRNGYSLHDLTGIILTHHHADHIGIVNRIVSAHQVPVFAHPLSLPHLIRDQDFLEMRIKFFDQLYQEMGCSDYGRQQIAYLQKALLKNKDQALQTDIVEIDSRRLFDFEIIEIPGHAQDQIAFYDRTNNWLFSGDLLIEHLSSNALVEPDQYGNRIQTLTQHVDSLQKSSKLNVGLVFPGHGVVIENPGKVFKKRLEQINAKSSKILQLIQAGITTGSELALTMYKNIYYEQFPLVMSQMIGQLDRLELQGKIKKKLVKSIWHYSAVEKK